MILQPNQLLHSKPAAIEGFYVAVAKHFNRMRLAVGGNTYTSAVRRAAVAAAATVHRGKMVSKSLVAAAHGGWHSLLSCTHSNNGHKFSLVVERLFACLLTRPCLLLRLGPFIYYVISISMLISVVSFQIRDEMEQGIFLMGFCSMRSFIQ